MHIRISRRKEHLHQADVRPWREVHTGQIRRETDHIRPSGIPSSVSHFKGSGHPGKEPLGTPGVCAGETSIHSCPRTCGRWAYSQPLSSVQTHDMIPTNLYTTHHIQKKLKITHQWSLTREWLEMAENGWKATKARKKKKKSLSFCSFSRIPRTTDLPKISSLSQPQPMFVNVNVSQNLTYSNFLFCSTQGTGILIQSYDVQICKSSLSSASPRNNSTRTWFTDEVASHRTKFKNSKSLAISRRIRDFLAGIKVKDCWSWGSYGGRGIFWWWYFEYSSRHEELSCSSPWVWRCVYLSCSGRPDWRGCPPGVERDGSFLLTEENKRQSIYLFDFVHKTGKRVICRTKVDRLTYCKQKVCFVIPFVTSLSNSFAKCYLSFEWYS